MLPAARSKDCKSCFKYKNKIYIYRTLLPNKKVFKHTIPILTFKTDLFNT